MGKNCTGETAYIWALKWVLCRSGLIVMFLVIIFTMIYTDSVIAGNGGNSNKIVSSNKARPSGSISRGAVGTWGYPGVSGPGGYPGVAGYGGYYPSWRHTKSKNYSGIDGNKSFPGIAGNKAYSGVAGNKAYSGVAGNKAYSGVAGSKSYSGIPGSDGYPGIPGD